MGVEWVFLAHICFDGFDYATELFGGLLRTISRYVRRWRVTVTRYTLGSARKQYMYIFIFKSMTHMPSSLDREKYRHRQ